MYTTYTGSINPTSTKLNAVPVISTRAVMVSNDAVGISLGSVVATSVCDNHWYSICCYFHTVMFVSTGKQLNEG